jgi:hypothetical protein
LRDKRNHGCSRLPFFEYYPVFQETDSSKTWLLLFEREAHVVSELQGKPLHFPKAKAPYTIKKSQRLNFASHHNEAPQ